METLNQEFVERCIENEKIGMTHPIDFEAIWETFGYTRIDNAKRFVLKQAETLTDCDLLSSEEKNIIHVENDKIRLSMNGFKFLLARARTEKGAEYLLYLINVERQYRSQLERQFTISGEGDTETKAMRQEVESLRMQLAAVETREKFCKSLKELHEISGIVNKSQVKGAVMLSFTEGEDYIVDGKDLRMTSDTFAILILSFRSRRGADITKLPQTIAVQSQRYFAYHHQKRSNTRRAHRECPGQMSLL